jgi:hypothetical protein
LKEGKEVTWVAVFGQFWEKGESLKRTMSASDIVDYRYATEQGQLYVFRDKD